MVDFLFSNSFVMDSEEHAAAIKVYMILSEPKKTKA